MKKYCFNLNKRTALVAATVMVLVSLFSASAQAQKKKKQLNVMKKLFL